MTAWENAPLLWQYEYGSKWITHSEQALMTINSAFYKGQKTVTVKEKEAKKFYIVNFETMVQKHKTSTRQQRVRCSVFDGSFYTWQWKDDDGDWISYSPKISVDLEISYKLKKFANFCKGQSYELDFSTFKQKNISTGNVRDVHREEIEVDLNTPTLNQIALAFTGYMTSKCQTDVNVTATAETRYGRKATI